MYTGTLYLFRKVYSFELYDDATFKIFNKSSMILTVHRNKKDIYWSKRDHEYAQRCVLTKTGYITPEWRQTIELHHALKVEISSDLYIMYMYVKYKYSNTSTRLSILNQRYCLQLDVLHEVYNDIISVHNSIKSKSGEIFENIIAEVLDTHGINYKRQVGVDKYGYIRDLSMNKSTIGCLSFVDFVIGTNIMLNDKISEYVVISAKTTCRERWKQDFMALSPKLYLLVTMSSDYPNQDKFGDSSVRKIVTSSKKNNETRDYVLSFEHLAYEIISAL